MADVSKLINVDRLLKKLQALEIRSKQLHDGSVIVGYSAAYAIYVHEDMSKTHGAAYNTKYASEIKEGLTKTGKVKKGWKGKTDRGSNQQAKFLEQPAREMGGPGGELAQIVTEQVVQGVPMQKALLVAGEALLRESMMIVPVETGNLKGSGFVAEG